MKNILFVALLAVNLAQAGANAAPIITKENSSVRLQDSGAKSKTIESSAQGEARLGWWREARFGMFIHWGIFSVPAGEWNGKMVDGNVEWIKAKAKIPDAEYDKFAGQFNPTQFNADDWVQLAQETGMKYLVFVAKHHDGFAMYHTKVDRYNVVDATPWKRDPAKELAEACARHGLKFCVYYSHNLDWHETNAIASRDLGPGSEHDFGKYMRDKALPQVKELLADYGPLGLMWFDMSGGMTREQAQPFVDLVRSWQPQCLINSRVSKGLVESDYLTKGDHAIPSGVGTAPWETPDTVTGFWGYKKNDPTTKSPAQLVFNLVDVVSKGGNYLLNVGPTAAGVIPQPTVESLHGLGRWMKVNGEAIYGCGPTAFGSELGQPSATETDPKTGKPKFLELRDWRCTTKPGRLYIHIFNWPATGKLELPAVNHQISKAYLLADRQIPVTFSQTVDHVILNLPVRMPIAIASVVCLEVTAATKQ